MSALLLVHNTTHLCLEEWAAAQQDSVSRELCQLLGWCIVLLACCWWCCEQHIDIRQLCLLPQLREGEQHFKYYMLSCTDLTGWLNNSMMFYKSTLSVRAVLLQQATQQLQGHFQVGNDNNAIEFVECEALPAPALVMFLILV